MDINTLYNNCNTSLKSNDTLLYIMNHSVYLMIISFNYDNTINLYADEWLYLIKYNYPFSVYYNNYINKANELISKKLLLPKIYIKEDVLQLFTTFSRGSIHGFSGFYNNIIYYLNNYENLQHLKIIMYKNCQQGILDLLNYFCEKKLINSDNIIYVENDQLYCFNSITYIPNKYHVFNSEFIPIVDNFINKYLLLDFYNNQVFNKNINTIILKTENTTNLSDNLIIKSSDVQEFAIKWNFNYVNNINEISMINTIYNSEILILNYGSCFFKNFVYISEICKKIIIIINTDIYINDYNHLSSITTNEFQGLILKKYKNAEIKYLIRDNLDFDPYTI